MPGSRILCQDELDKVQSVWNVESQASTQFPPTETGITCEASIVSSKSLQHASELETSSQTACEAAYQKGLKDGEQRAEEERKKYAEWNTSLASAVQTIVDLKVTVRQETIRDLISLSLGIARRILHREVHVDPDALRGIVQVAIERINREDLVRIHTHPNHCMALEHAITELSPTPPVEIVADQNLAEGSVVLETTRGNLDGSIDTQLNEIRRGMADVLRR